MILAVSAAALLRAWLSLLKAFAVIFLALRLGTLASLLDNRLLKVLNRIDILAIFALALGPAYPALREALAVLGLALRLRALAAHLALDLRLVGVQGQQIVYLAFSWVRREVQ